MLARSERGTEEELLTVLPGRIQAHGERLWKATVSQIHVSSFHLVRLQPGLSSAQSSATISIQRLGRCVPGP